MNTNYAGRGVELRASEPEVDEDKWRDGGAKQAKDEKMIAEFVPGFDWAEFEDAAAELRVPNWRLT